MVANGNNSYIQSQIIRHETNREGRRTAIMHIYEFSQGLNLTFILLRIGLEVVIITSTMMPPFHKWLKGVVRGTDVM
jgi:hypothetical protein